MSLVRVPDGAGKFIEYVEKDGYRLCSFNFAPEVTGERLVKIRELPCRSDDVFICAPCKSGTHWLWEIVSMMYQGKAETIPVSKVFNMLEASPRERIDELESPRVLNTHVHIPYMPTEAFDKKCKIIFALRNPKDVAVSMYNHVKGITLYKYSGEWKNFMPLFLYGETEYGDWFDYVLEWKDFIDKNKDYPIHMVYYEDLKENFFEEIQRLGSFLGVENKDSLFEKITEKCTFKKMQKDKISTMKFLKDDFSMYRKGDIGDWKNWFTVAQSEQFDAVYKQKMGTREFNFRYSYRDTKNGNK